MANIEKRIETAKTIQVNRRNYRRARDRALAKLAQIHPDEYQELLEEERARDEAEGKSWLDLSGRTKRSMGSAGAPDRDSTVSEPHQDGDNPEEGDLG